MHVGIWILQILMWENLDFKDISEWMFIFNKIVCIFDQAYVILLYTLGKSLSFPIDVNSLKATMFLRPIPIIVLIESLAYIL